MRLEDHLEIKLNDSRFPGAGYLASAGRSAAADRGANEYRPNYVVPGKKVTQGRSSRAANTGYVNYINYSAFVLPPIKDAAGNVLSPFGNASRNPGRLSGL